MALNIFPRRKELEKEPLANQETEALPEPSPEAMAALDEDGADRKRTRRGTRGGRGRKRPNGEAAELAAVETEAAVEAQTPEPAPRRAPRRAKPVPEEINHETVVAAETHDAAIPDEKPSRRRAAARKPAAEEGAPAPTTNGSGTAILHALEKQGRQIEQLLRQQEELRRTHGVPGTIAAPPARVGIFVDAANIELACDRLRARFDWGKILSILTKDRVLVRAIAYSPVHDDPNVSIETQRFVEPFLDKGFKVVTKPLKRFQDGTIKANVDIELALDIITMLDRLDVVCLISGDGDFQRLVELVQSRGVRVEVVSVGPSTASNLRNAADGFLDLQSRLKEIRA